MNKMSQEITVQEFVNQKRGKKLWLCPSIVNNIKFNPDPVLKGLECTESSIPEVLKDKYVRTYFNENGTLCIIWENS